MSPFYLLSPFFLYPFFTFFFIFLHFSLLISFLLFAYLISTLLSLFLSYIFHSTLLPSLSASRGALTIEEAIESLRALLKAVELQEEDSAEEEEEEGESGKGDDQSKSNTVVTPSASKAATYRSYTISEIIRITE